jgi:ABC-type transport system involved in multi-copper enzyme maturation permease subunit
MPVETAAEFSFFAWMPWAVLGWLLIVASLTVAGVAVGWLIAALQKGPVAATRTTFRVLGDAARDLTLLSPRRVEALAWLTVKESIRRRVVVVFALFIVILMFAGWFLDPTNPDPARLYISFVLTTTSYLLLVLALLLSALSIPTDIKNRTLHTVVTKPVRPSEIVLGRIVGFVVVGTGLLTIMGAISYVFVLRGLAHRHEVASADLEVLQQACIPRPGEEAPKKQLALRTTKVHGHQHTFYIDPVTRVSGSGKPVVEFPKEGVLRTEAEEGHWHDLGYKVVEGRSGDEAGPGVECEIGPEQGMLVARVPVFGELRFKDRAGQDKKQGINIGDEWEYRSFIDGGTLAAAVWTFDGIKEQDYPDGLPVEMTIEVSRSHKGDIEKTVRGSLVVRNPQTRLMTEVRIFPTKKFLADSQFIPRELEGAKGERYDLFRDFVADGKVELWLRCIDPQQYLGAAPHDLYLRRAGDASFLMNFAKAYFGIWLQMVLVIGFGVMFSTVLSGPIAMLATAAAVLGGMFVDFVTKLAQHQVIGGGPMEQLIRMLTQQNITTELEPGLRTTVAQLTDRVVELPMYVLSSVLPDFGKLSFPDDQGRLCVASGFDIAPDAILQGTAIVLGFVLPLIVAGYFFLKTREVA